MKIDYALEMAKEWTQGQTFHEGSEGWRPAIAVMLAEIESLRKQAENYRRDIADPAPDIVEAVLSKHRSHYTEERVLKAVHESGLHQYAPGVIRSLWQDGIDVDVPHSALMNFVRKLTGSV